jgi:CysZ protein
VPAPRKLGFVDGALAPWRGLGFVLGTPSAWPFAAVPAVIFVALSGAIGAIGVTLVQHATASLASAGSTWIVAGAWALRVVLWLAAVGVGVLLGLALAQPLSGPALDAIVEQQERALGGRVHAKQPALATALRALRVNLLSLAATLGAIVLLTLVEFAFAPAAVVTTPLKFVISSVVLAWDLVDYPLGLRGAGVRARLAWFRTHFSVALGFGLSLGLVFLVPCAGLLLLPAGVAGATRIVLASEDEDAAARALGGAKPPWLLD